MATILLVVRDVTADDGLTERVRVLRIEASHFCSQTAWASCPSGTCSDCEVLAALALERECRPPVCIR
jgi:hypothetical protein